MGSSLATELAGVVVWRYEPATGRVQFSEAGLGMLGLVPRPEGLTLDDFTPLVHPDDLVALLAAGREAGQSNRPVDLPIRYRHRDGHWHHALTRRAAHRGADGELMALLGVAMDVTEREASRLELRSAAERLALTMRAVGIGTWWHDAVAHSNHWDEQMWVLRGLTPRPETPTLPEMLALVHPEDRERVLSEIERSIARGQDSQYDFRVILPDGRERWLASRSVQVHDGADRVLRRIGVNWDVTDARQAAAARHEKELAQRESQAKSELLARLSHELRTPLNAILGFSQLLLVGDAQTDASTRQERLRHIHSAGTHLLGLINDVLELSRPDGGTDQQSLVPVALAALMAEVLPMVEATATTKQVRLWVDLPATLAVQADRLRLRQVLLNLLTNAIKYNHEGGEVRIGADRLDEAVQLRVSDSGIGMAPAQIAQAFEPFQRLRANPSGIEGVGLGLAIVKTLVQRMGGTIAVHSVPGQGTEVTLCLPSAQRPAAQPASAPPQVLKPPATTMAPHDGMPRRRLLYIEDNAVNAMIVAELAATRQAQLEFRTADTGEAGMALARQFLPDLILLDMHLPDAHGLQVLARLRQEPLTRHIPCIALSANAMPEDIRQALGQGFADYWTKPLDFGVFNAAMDALLRVH